MKNLKRTLCLVLCLVMAIGLLATGASAAFKDDSTITYKEAVSLLSGLGVINGYPEDNTFRPTASFNRAGLAKMVAFFCWGGTDFSNYYEGASVFADTEKYAWAQGSINFGYNAGFISGAGVNADNKLVYNPAGIVKGSELAKTLLCCLGYKADAKNPTFALTGANWELNSIRIAQGLGFFAGMEDFNPTATLTREQAAQIFYNVLTGAKIMRVTGYNDDGSPKAYSEVIAFDPAAPYFSDVTKAGAANDAFGRGIFNYTKNGKVIATTTAVPTLTYTAPVTQAKVFADLALTANIAAPGSNNVFVNSKTASAKQGLAYNGGKIENSGNGVLTEVYYDGTSIKFVFIDTYYGTVSAVTPATAVDKRTITVDGKTFVTDSFAVKDTVLYTKADDVIKSVEAVSLVEMTATSYVTGTSFVAGGTTYTYSANKNATVGDFDAHKVALDKYGYVIHVEGITTDPNFAVVTKVGSTQDQWGVSTYIAEIVKPNGAAETVTVAENATSKLNTVVTYTVANDVYTLAAVTGSYTGATKGTFNSGAATVSSGVKFETKTGVSAFSYGGTNNVKANAKTIFIVRSGAGSPASPYAYATYTGIANVPSLSTADKAAGYVVSYNGFAKVVYVVDASPVSAQSSDVIFVMGAAVENNVKVGTSTVTYYTAQVVANGKIESMNLHSNYSIGVYTVKSTDANGYIELAFASAVGSAIKTNSVYDSVGETISINGTDYAVASDCAVYTYNTTTKTIAVSSLSALKANAGGIYTLASDLSTTGSDVVKAIYVPETAGTFTVAVPTVTSRTGVTVVASGTSAASGSTVTVTVKAADTTNANGTVTATYTTATDEYSITAPVDNAYVAGTAEDIVFTFTMPAENVTAITATVA